MAPAAKINLTARLLPLGDSAMTVEFGEAISRVLNDRVLAARRAIEAAAIAGVRELVPTFRSLAVHYDPAEIGFDDLAARIGDVDLAASITAQVTRAALPTFYFHDRGG